MQSLTNTEKLAFISGYTSSWATSQVLAISAMGQIPSKQQIEHLLSIAAEIATDLIRALQLIPATEDDKLNLLDFATAMNRKARELNLGA